MTMKINLTVINQDPLLSLILHISTKTNVENTVKITIKAINIPLKVNKCTPSIKSYVKCV